MAYLTPRQRRDQSTKTEYIAPRQRRLTGNDIGISTKNTISSLDNVKTKDIEYWEARPGLNKLFGPDSFLGKVTGGLSAANDVAGAAMRATAFGDVNNLAQGGLKPTTGSNTADTILKGIGTISAFGLPSGGGAPAMAAPIRKVSEYATMSLGKALGKTPKGLLGRVTDAALTGAIESLPYTAHQIAVNPELQKPNTILRTASENLLLGTGAELGIIAFGKGISALKEAFKKPVEEIIKSTDVIPLQKLIKPKTLQGKFTIKNLQFDNAVNDYNNAIETIQNHFKTNELRASEIPQIKTVLGIDLDNIINRMEQAQKHNLASVDSLRLRRAAGVASDNAYEIIEKVKAQGELPRREVKELSKAVELNPFKPKGKPRQFISNSVLNSQVAPDAMKQTISKSTYEPISNKLVWDKAIKRVELDPAGAKNIFDGMDSIKTADDTALGEALITRAIKKGNISEANRLSVNLAEKLTQAGQAVQAASIFKRLTPEGMLMYAQRTIGKANREIEKAEGKIAKKVALTVQETKLITEKMKSINELPDGREKDVELAKVMKVIADKIPSSIREKVAGLQRISMLLNPKTMIRNTLGNVVFGAVDNTSNVLGAGIDKLVSLKTGKRTTALPDPATIGRGLKKGISESIEDARIGVDTSPTRLQYELPNKRLFNNPLLNKLDQATKTGLMIGDRPFWQAHYDDVLSQQMKANKVKEATQEMIDTARQVADERTYQDINTITKIFTGLRKALNAGKEFGLGSITMPFAKTPSNILMRAFEYTPGGLAKAINEAVQGARTGMFNQRKFVDNLSRSITGSGAIMAGYTLAKSGIITGKADKDKDVNNLQRSAGKGNYAVKIGDTYQTYDWAQPMSLLLAIGADMYNNGMSEDQVTSAALEAITSGGNTLFDQPLLQGLKRLLGSYNSERGLVGNLADTAASLPAQFVPTLLKQGAQLVDPLQRSTYSPNYLENNIINPLKVKVPFLSKTLEPRIDSFGNEIKAFQGKNNIFNVMFNPGFSTEYKPNKIQKEILRIYDSTGDKIQFPRVAPYSFTWKGNKIDLTPQEYIVYQKRLGQLTEQRFTTYMNDKNFPLIRDEIKAKQLQSILTDVNAKVKQEILNSRGE